VSSENIAKLVDAVEEEVSRSYQREVASHLIGEAVMKYLRRLDPIAYVRFASVYREFRDVRQLVDEAQEILERSKTENPSQQDLFS
jgi:transcriptional repressor NrdR